MMAIDWKYSDFSKPYRGGGEVLDTGLSSALAIKHENRQKVKEVKFFCNA